MPISADFIQTRDHLDQLNQALDSGAFIQVRRLLESLPPADVAHVLESSPPKVLSLIHL